MFSEKYGIFIDNLEKKIELLKAQEDGINLIRGDLRNLIEDIFKMLNRTFSSTEEGIVAINMALNATHVNGSMLQYLEQDTDEENLQAHFEEMSNLPKEKVETWNKQLREIGVQV